MLKGSGGPAAELHADLSAPGRKYPASETEFLCETALPPEVLPPVARYYENIYLAVTAGAKLLNPLSETETLVRMIDEAGNIAKETCAL